MVSIDQDAVAVPCDVPADTVSTYIENYLKATRNTGRMMMFAGDQKIEHLNDDFFGKTDSGDISPDDHSPSHLFRIAAESCIGVFASQLGLINRYARHFPCVNYIAKLNSKSHLVPTEQREPVSRSLWSVSDVMNVKQRSGVNIVGVGYTIYLGSEYESLMLTEAARVITDAHSHGLIAVLWIYPRGKAVPDEKDPHLIAGACGVAACLGADFVKVNYPDKAPQPEQALREAVKAAGNTGVILAGGKSTGPRDLLQQLHAQVMVAGAAGNATGRNIHQRNHAEAVSLCNAIASITLGGRDVDFAEQVYLGEQTFSLD